MKRLATIRRKLKTWLAMKSPPTIPKTTSDGEAFQLSDMFSVKDSLSSSTREESDSILPLLLLLPQVTSE